jgi:hypothetical protein
MKRIVSQHLGLWVLAGALFVGLGVASAMPQKDKAVEAEKITVYAPRAAQTIVQDPSGVFFGYRNSMAAGQL